ncbi:HisA/HisF-related TIM barrel protein [Brevibacterium sp. NPDC056947]|uniref:HisA/HisF-related TIM barrel protein n=1 Tax=Brevibacterium sp. NPDC056947 TaxID=3345974 RepID=UPI003628ABBB
MTDKLVLLPAVDVADGKAVRLVQGEAGTETDYGSPIDAAHDFEERGAEWIHLVDLDAAFGRGSNSDLLNQVVKAVGIKVELSGGIRDTESLERALDTGAERVAIGLDVRGQTLAARGWTKDGGDLFEVLTGLEEAGCARYVVTDVRKDGTLQGPNLDLLESMSTRTDKPITASGGVSSLDDLRSLRSLVPAGVDSAIVGKALYAGQFTLEEALDVAGR